MQPIRMGILGSGRIVKRWLRDMPSDVQIVAIASRDLERARAAAEALGIASFEAPYEALLAREDIDAVYVAMPNEGHMEYAMAAMRAKKHVLCEKPVAVNAWQFRQMMDCAKENQVLLMEAMWSRCFPAIVRLHEHLAQGTIGELKHVHAAFAGRFREGSGSRIFDPLQAGGSLLDIGCYCVHFANACFGVAPNGISGQLEIGESQVDEQAAIALRYPSGGMATLFASVRVSEPSTAWVNGTEGRIEVPDFWHADRLILHLPGKEPQEERFPYEPEGFAFEVRHFCECIRAGKIESPLVPWNASLAAMEVMDTLRAQAGLTFPLAGEK